MGIVQPPRAIDAQPHIEVLIGQKRAPLLIEERAVGLKVVQAGPPVGEVAFLQLHGASKEVESRQRRLAAMPHERDDRSWAGLHDLTDVGFQQGVRHPESMRASVEARGIEIVAVGAIQVAYGTDRLRHDHEGLASRFLISRDSAHQFAPPLSGARLLDAGAASE